MQEQDITYPLRVAYILSNGKEIYAGGKDDNGDFAVAVFTDEDLAERYIREGSNGSARIKEINNDAELTAILKEMKRAGFTTVIFDTSGRTGYFSARIRIDELVKQLRERPRQNDNHG